MCKKILFTISLFFMFSMFTIIASAATLPPITVLFDNHKITFDVQPQIINGRTMVPLKGIFDALKISIDWNQKTQTVTGTKEDTVIKLIINNSAAYVNGRTVKLDSPAVIKNGRTLVPLRFIAEATESRVIWNGNARQVCIYFNTLAPQDGNTASNSYNELYRVERDGYTYTGGDGIIKEKDGAYIKHIIFGRNLYLNVTSQYFFYSNPDENFKIYRLNLDGTHSTFFKGTENSFDLTVRDGVIYYINRGDQYSTYSIKADGTGIKKLNTGSTICFNITDNYIYYLSQSGNSTNIYRMNKDGTNKICLYKGIKIENMLVTNGGIFFSDFQGISEINLDGTGYKIITRDIGYSLNFKGNKLYYTNFSDHFNIYTITTNKNIRNKVNDEASSNLIILGDDIYYKTKDKNNVLVTKKNKIEASQTDVIPVLGNQQGKYLGTAVLTPDFTYTVKDFSGQNRTFSFNWGPNDYFKKDAVVLGDWVYYLSEYCVPGTSDYQHFIFRKRLDGTGSKMLISHVNSIYDCKYTVVGDWIYYLSDNKEFMKVKTDGTCETVIKYIDVNSTPFDTFGNTFVVSGDWIYYQYHSAQLNTTALYRMKTDGSQAQKYIDFDFGNLIGSSGNTLYASQTYSNPETGRTERKGIAISLNDKTSKVIENGLWIPEFNENTIPEGKLYMVKYNTEKNVNELYYSDLDGNKETYVLTVPDTAIDGTFNILDNYLYYQNNYNNKYERIIINDSGL